MGYCLIDWEDDIIAPGPNFDLKKLSADDCKAIVEPYLDAISSGDDEYKPFSVILWSEGRSSTLVLITSCLYCVYPEDRKLSDLDPDKGDIPLVITRSGVILWTLQDSKEWQKMVARERKKVTQKSGRTKSTAVMIDLEDEGDEVIKDNNTNDDWIEEDGCEGGLIASSSQVPHAPSRQQLKSKKSTIKAASKHTSSQPNNGLLRTEHCSTSTTMQHNAEHIPSNTSTQHHSHSYQSDVQTSLRNARPQQSRSNAVPEAQAESSPPSSPRAWTPFTSHRTLSPPPSLPRSQIRAPISPTRPSTKRPIRDWSDDENPHRAPRNRMMFSHLDDDTPRRMPRNRWIYDDRDEAHVPPEHQSPPPIFQYHPPRNHASSHVHEQSMHRVTGPRMTSQAEDYYSQTGPQYTSSQAQHHMAPPLPIYSSAPTEQDNTTGTGRHGEVAISKRPRNVAVQRPGRSGLGGGIVDEHRSQRNINNLVQNQSLRNARDRYDSNPGDEGEQRAEYRHQSDNVYTDDGDSYGRGYQRNKYTYN